jgi:uncharacterized protein (TIGR02001 family)
MKRTALPKKALECALAFAAISATAALAQTPAPAPEPAPAPAAAPAPTPEHTFTANVGLFSQYIFRGLTQTDRRPALQGGFDYAHSSGFYAGVWGSNISWISDFSPGVSASLELDTYLGYKMTFAEDWGLDVGFLRYNYPGDYHGITKANTNELYIAGSWKWAYLKYSHSIGDDTFGIPDSKNTYYIDGTAAVPLPYDLTLTLHGGHQAYKGASSNDDYSYTDWRIELAWAFAKDWLTGAGFTDTNAKKEVYTPVSTGRFIGDHQVYAFVKKTF